jgi:hypothetical protein
MGPTLSVEGLVVRPWQMTDAAALAPACGDPDICRFTTVPTKFSPGAARAWITSQNDHERRGTAVVLAIEPASVGYPVGMVGLFGLRSHDGPRLGYWLTRGTVGADWASRQRGCSPSGRWRNRRSRGFSSMSSLATSPPAGSRSDWAASASVAAPWSSPTEVWSTSTGSSWSRPTSGWGAAAFSCKRARASPGNQVGVTATTGIGRVVCFW